MSRWLGNKSAGGTDDNSPPVFNHWPLLIAAGLSIGMAFMTRQLDAVTLTLPFALLLLRRPISVALVAAGAAVPLVLFALYNIAVTGNPTASGYLAAAPWDHIGFGANVGGPTAYERGFDLARAFWNIAYDLEHLQIALLGWPFFVGLAIVAVPFISGRAGRWDWMLVASCLLVVAAYACYWASGVTGGLPRYWYAIVPWLCILAARGLWELVAWPASIRPFPRISLAAALPGPSLFVAAMLYFNLHYFLPTNVTYYQNSAGAVVATVRAHHIHHALIFQRQHNSQHSEYEVIFSQNSPLLNGDILWALDLGPKRNAAAMAAHPGRAYYLMDGVKLTRLSANR